MERVEFEDTARKYQDMVYRIAFQYFGNHADAEDVVQDTFLRLYTYQKPFESPEHLRRWLIRVTVNLCRDALKSPWRKRRVSIDAVPEIPVFQEPEEDALYREVMRLPEKYRVILELFYYEELSTQEIADMLRVRRSTVTTRLSRARKLLKKHLMEVWQHEESKSR